MSFPSPRQLKLFWEKVASGEISRAAFQEFLQNPNKVKEEDYVVPLEDSAVPRFLQPLCARYRKMATEWEVSVNSAVAYRVKAGLALDFAPSSGPCYEGLSNVPWHLFEDVPVRRDSIVFWVPCPVPVSERLCRADQLELLRRVRHEYDLPEHHLSSFGSAGLVVGLIHAHHHTTGEVVPEMAFVRTDTKIKSPEEMDSWIEVEWCEGGVGCAQLGDSRSSNRVFAIGVEEL